MNGRTNAAGIVLPELALQAGAGQILNGYQAIGADGSIITGTIPSRGAQTITPGTAAQQIPAGRYLSGAQTIAGDADLIPGNIRSGVNIFGVSGTYSGTAPSSGQVTESMVDAGWYSLTVTLPSNIGTLLGLFMQFSYYAYVFVNGMPGVFRVRIGGVGGGTDLFGYSISGRNINIVGDSNTPSDLSAGFYCYIPA